jgi:hypothetical protein
VEAILEKVHAKKILMKQKKNQEKQTEDNHDVDGKKQTFVSLSLVKSKKSTRLCQMIRFGGFLQMCK